MAEEHHREIERVKASYAHHPLPRLKALLPTKSTYERSGQYDQLALIELIAEREQQLAAKIAQGASLRAWIAIGLSLLAMALTYLREALWPRQLAPVMVNPAPVIVNVPPPTIVTGPLSAPQTSSGGPAGGKSPAGPGSPARGTSTTPSPGSPPPPAKLR